MVARRGRSYRSVNRGFWVILSSIIFFLISTAASYANETDVGFNTYPILPDTTSEGASPDLFTGTMSYRIPIKVPPGRNGMIPKVELTYRSSNGNGCIGMGWEIEMGSIQQVRLNGSSEYQWRRTDGAFDLVSSDHSDVYTAVQDGSFARISRLSDSEGRIYWEAVNKEGTRFFFGQTVGSRQDESNPDVIHRWCLDKILDTNGNYVTFRYAKERGQIYIEQINYTGNGAISPTNTVNFVYEDGRSDARVIHSSVISSSNLSVTTTKRLTMIRVLANQNLVRSYSLTYDYGPSTGRSLLSSVTEHGSDSTSLPPITLKYGQDNYEVGARLHGWYSGIRSDWPKLAAVNGRGFWNFNGNPITYTDPYQANTQCILGLFDLDGKTDLACYNEGKWEMGLSTKRGTVQAWTGPTIYDTTTNPSDPIYGAPVANQCLAGDFQGIGRTDIICYPGSGSTWSMALASYIIDDGWYSILPWSGPTLYSGSPIIPAGYICMTGDFDGDGATDLACYTGAWNMALSTARAGYGWQSLTWPNGPIPNLPIGKLVVDQCITGEFNGDGKTDLLCLESGGWKLALSTGNGWETLSWSGPAISTNFSIRDQCIIGDLNGDGITDLACHNSNSKDVWDVALSMGSGWQIRNWIGPSLTNPHVSYQCLTGDFNGDGKTDFACLDQYGPNSGNIWQVALSTVLKEWGFPEEFTWKIENWDGPTPLQNVPVSKQCIAGNFMGAGKTGIACYSGDVWDEADPVDDDYSVSDLLTSVLNGLGSEMYIEYWPSSTKDPDSWVQLSPKLPFPVHTVRSITTYDNCNSGVGCTGSSSKTSFLFSGGFFQISAREFRGFNYVKVAGPAGPEREQKITETWFHQGDDLAVGVNNPNTLDAISKGLPYRTRVSGLFSEDSVFTDTVVETSYRIVSDFYHVMPWQIDTYICASGICGGSGNSTHVRTVYAYDNYGNRTREDQYRNISDSTDDRTVIRTYAYNPEAWIVGLPASESIYQGTYPSTTNPSSFDPEKKVSSTTFYYDGVDNCTSQSNNQIPTRGNLTRVVRWLKDGTSPETWMAYDPYGNLACSRDANSIAVSGGPVTSFGYDTTFSFLKISTNPLGQITTTEYYGVDGVPADKGHYGQVKTVTDPNGAATTSEYDVFGRVTRAARGTDNSWKAWSYNNFGTVGSQNVRLDTSAGLWSETYFDGLGRTIKEKKSGPDGKTIVTDTQYDARGAIANQSLPYFQGTETRRYKSFGYDPMGRVLKETSADPKTQVLYCYDGRVTVRIDPNKFRKRETRDADGRLTRLEEYKNTYPSCTTEVGNPYATTVYEYDILGNLSKVTDAKQNQTVIHYDTLGRKKDMLDPDMGLWKYEYDGNGNLRLQTDAKNQKIRFDYDSINRLTSKDYGADGVVETTYGYDEPSSSYPSFPLGRLTSMNDLSGRTQYFYDQLGRVKYTVKTIDGMSKTVGKTYDHLDRISTLTYPDDLETVIYEYDTGGNVYKVGSYATYTNYNAVGQAGRITFGNGITTDHSFKSANRNNWLSSITTSSSTLGTLVALVYDYYDNGSIKSLTDNVNATVPSNVASQKYSLFPGKAHAYGPIGSNFQYDANGNMTSDGVLQFAYNYDNKPETVSYEGRTVRYIYDGTGTRVEKAINNYITTYFDKVYECTNGACLKYIFAGDNRVAVKSAIDTYYYHTDHLGSTVAVTNDSSGIQTENIVYHPFGEIASDTGTGGVSQKYTSQEFDLETGLYNYNARLYSSEMGRFIAPDTIVPDYGNPQSLNRYAYVLNNPLLYKDPTGKAFTPFHMIVDFPGATLGWLAGSGPSPLTVALNNFNLDKNYNQITPEALAPHANAWPILDTGLYATRGEALGAASRSFVSNVDNGNSVWSANHTFYDILTHWGGEWGGFKSNELSSWLSGAAHLLFNDIVLGALFSPIALVESVGTNAYSAVSSWFNSSATSTGNGSGSYDFGNSCCLGSDLYEFGNNSKPGNLTYHFVNNYNLGNNNLGNESYDFGGGNIYWNYSWRYQGIFQ